MAKKNDCWGIEVGANALKAIRLVRRGNDVNVAEYDILPFKKVLTTPDLNVDEAIEVQLDTFLTRHQVNKSTVMVSVPSTAAFHKFAKLPPVDPKKIPEMVRFEAVQQIPFPMDEVEWDYQVFSSPDSPDTSVGIVAITKEKVNNFLKNYREVGLNVDGLTLSPMAVYNAIVYDMNLTPESPGTIIMDIGTSNTDLIIYENGQLWMRRMQIGGNNFTDALMRAFKLGFSKAERLKREAGTSKYARQIFQAMRPVFADLVQEIQRSLGYYQSINRDAHLTRLVGVGSTFRLRGIQKFLKQQLQMDVIKPDGFKRLQIEGPASAEFVENSISFCTAYGLALQGLDLESLDINIMPRDVLKQRLWKAKQPMFIATAASLALAAGISWVKLQSAESEFEKLKESSDVKVVKTEKQALELIREYKADVSLLDPRQKISNLQRILDYRDLWPKLLVDLDDSQAALNPQPIFRVHPRARETVYAEIMAIPRSERQKMYINSMTSKYNFAVLNATGAAAAPAGAQAPMSFSFPGQERPGRRLSTSQTVTAASGTQNVNTGWQDGQASPQFDITIKGTIPSTQAPILLGRDYLAWLAANAAKSDRPYRIIIPPQQQDIIVYLAQKAGAPGTGAAPRPGGFGAAGGGPGVGGGAPGFGPAAAWRAPGAGPAAPVAAANAGQFTKPLALESPVGDYEFELQFTVEVVNPSILRERSNPKTPTSQMTPANPSETSQSSATDKPAQPMTDARTQERNS